MPPQPWKNREPKGHSKGPVLNWLSFWGAPAAGVPALNDLPHQCPTTSGRAALALAVDEFGLLPGSPILLPSYQCPSMAAAVVHAGFKPVFYGMDENLEPDWYHMPVLQERGALGVAHYFGNAKGLDVARLWCDVRGWALIEDCAHA